ncbi:MAG: hypothetical protein LQ350_007799 [Teloschistes chrysophthalmus]|nr:MAG: hypothetical protein LQ350_007799 [Niorma chrysophthalma]
MATTPTSAPEFGHISNTHIYRKKSASLDRIVRFSPYKLPQNDSSLLNLSGHPHAHPNPSPPTSNLPVVSQPPTFTTEGETFIHTTHVQPGFILYRDRVQCTPSTAQFKQIKELFPTCFKVSFSPPFIIIVCRVLPAKPWPVTVAGIPAWLTDDENAQPMDIGINAFGPKVSLQAPIKIWVPAAKAVAEEIITIFRNLGAPISRLRWLGWCFLVLASKVTFDDWRVRLPRTINNIHVGYIFREDVLQEKALRRKVHFDDVPDNEAYETLRPGVIVSSKSLGAQYDDTLTISGVCVQSPDGEKYITLAHRGFPAGVDESVYHPDRRGKIIGEIAKVFNETGIALANLDPTY